MLKIQNGAQWRNGRASDSELRGPGFDPYRQNHVVSLSKTHELPTVLVKPRKRWLRPDMTEKLLTWTLSLNTKKQNSKYWDFYTSPVKVIIFNRKLLIFYMKLANALDSCLHMLFLHFRRIFAVPADG